MRAPPPAGRRWQRVRALLEDQRRRQRLLFVAGVAALLLVGVIGAWVLLSTVQPLALDLRITRTLQQIRAPWFHTLMVAVSLPGRAPWSWLIIGTTSVLAAIALGRRHALFLVLVALIQGLINLLIKLAIGRPRPLDTIVDVFRTEQGNSFPSGHVMFYTIFFGMLAYLALMRLPGWAGRALALLLASLIALVGPSRIYLGAHWFSDVVAAYVLGLIGLGFAIECYGTYVQVGVKGQQEGVPPS